MPAPKKAPACGKDGCTTRPSYGLVIGSKPLRCARHGKEEDMVPVKNKKMCEECHKKTAAFGLELKKPTHCKEHKDDKMFDIVHKMCEECHELRASFGVEAKKPTHCKKHKSDNMVDVVSKMCVVCHKIHANFGLEANKPTHCEEHKSENMFDVAHKMCEECHKTRPTFGFPGKQPTRCKEHILSGMEDLVHITCLNENCKIRACFGLELGKPLYCEEHSSADMKDVVHARCEYAGCTIQRTFGYEMGKPLRCQEHASNDMQDVTHARCNHDGCILRSSFGYKQNKPLRCREHAEPNMQDVVNKLCLADHCDTIAMTEKYKGYCTRCFINLFPDEPLTRAYKIKETHVAEAVTKMLSSSPELTHAEVIYDKTVSGGCSRRRPDIRIELYTHNIIIECDEFQHNRQEYCNCEDKRHMQLFIDLGSRPIVFIRFNPDNYKDSAGKRYPSCFKYHKTFDVPLVADQKYWQARLKVLQDRLFAHTNIPEQEVTIEHLFYNGFI